MMPKILFLDIDGVLHADHEPQLARLPLFEQYLAQMPQLHLVISSTWREDYDLNELRALFSPQLQGAIIDVTPSLEQGYDVGGRQREIEQFLQQYDDAADWVALDDWRSFFDETCSRLIWVDPNFGFQAVHGDQLLRWYNSAA